MLGSLTFGRPLPPELRAGEHDGVDQLVSAESDGGGALDDASGLQGECAPIQMGSLYCRSGCSIAYVDGLQLARVGRGAGNIPDVLGGPLCGGGADRGREDQEDDRGDGGGGIHGGSCTDESGSVVNCDAAFILWSGGTVHLLSQA